MPVENTMSGRNTNKNSQALAEREKMEFKKNINEENLMDEVIENMEYMVRVMDQEDNIIYMNKKMRDEFGDLTCHKCYDLLGVKEKCLDCVTAKCQKTDKAESKDIQYGQRFFKVIASPARTKSERKYSIELFHDITVQKVLQEEILNQYDKMKTDLEFAKQIQNRVLPGSGTYWNSLILDTAYLPSEDLGGDMFDLIRVDEDHIMFYMADVSGHGIRSSLLTMFLRQAIRGIRQDALEPTKMLTEIIRSYNDLKLSDEYYVSILFGLYCVSEKTITFLNAGHNCLPLYLRKSGNMETLKIYGMPVCNLLKEARHEMIRIEVGAGDKIIMYTDGITEAYNETNGEYFTEDRLNELVSENKMEKGSIIVEKVIDAIGAFSKGPLIDDAAIIVIEII